MSERSWQEILDQGRLSFKKMWPGSRYGVLFKSGDLQYHIGYVANLNIGVSRGWSAAVLLPRGEDQKERLGSKNKKRKDAGAAVLEASLDRGRLSHVRDAHALGWLKKETA